MLFVFCSGFVLLGCRQHDWRELEIEVPEMHNEAAIRLVMNAMGQAPGIRPGTVVVDPHARLIRFEYNSLLVADMNFVHLIADAGFTANGIPGNQEARENWPPEVRQ